MCFRRVRKHSWNPSISLQRRVQLWGIRDNQIKGGICPHSKSAPLMKFKIVYFCPWKKILLERHIWCYITLYFIWCEQFNKAAITPALVKFISSSWWDRDEETGKYQGSQIILSLFDFKPNLMERYN